MISRKKSKSTRTPYEHNDQINIFYEMKFGKDEIIAGTPLRFKYERGTFKFIKMVYHGGKDITWIDCIDSTTGIFRSFYVSQLKGVVKPRNKRRKKISV